MRHREEWLRVVTRCRADLVARLGSGSHRDRIAAEWELIWHRHLIVRGWEFTYCADLRGTTPDFVVSSPTPLVLEIRTVFDDSRLEQDDMRVGRVMERLRPAATRPWKMEMIGEMPYISDADLTAATERFVNAQAYGTPVEVGSLRLEVDDDVSKFADVSNFAGFTVGIRIHYITTEKQIAQALREKLGRYTADIIGDQPFVVGVCAGDPSISTEAVVTALYGQEQLRILSDRTTGKIVEQSAVRIGGLFKDEENRHLSAVVHCKFDSLHPQEIQCEVLHNPLAAFPVPENLFAPWPETRWLEPNDQERLMVTHAGDPRMAL